MEPYNHEANNIYEACGIDEQSFKERVKENEVLEYFSVFNERELAIMLSSELAPMYTDDHTAIMVFARPHVKLRPFNLNRKRNNFDIEQLVSDVQMLSDDVRINKFASWHSWIVLSYALINRRSYAVKFIEENYSKSEIYVLMLFRHAMKMKGLELAKDNAAEMLKMLKMIANDSSPKLAPVSFDGKVKQDEEYDILGIDDDFTDRMIVQNDPTHRLLYSNANSVAQIYGVSYKSMLDIVEECDNVKHFINRVNELKLTDIEQAVFYSSAIDSLELEKMFCRIPITMPSLVSYYQHTNNKTWCDEMFAYDSIERVQWFLDHNVTLEDVERIIKIYNPEYEYL
jgi:hypothetical protein